jgi:hypothetical protein
MPGLNAFWSKFALASACLFSSMATAPAADAKITTLYTISDFQPTIGGVQLSSIKSIAGSFTTGTTGADSTSKVTLVENVGGSFYTYNYSGREDGPGWSQPSQFTSSPFFPATLRINPFGPGPVSTGVSVSLTDFVYGGTGTVTITASPVKGVPEPAAWAMLLIGVGAVGVALRSRRRKRTMAFASI